MKKHILAQANTRNHHNYLFKKSPSIGLRHQIITRDKNMPEQWTKLEDLRYHFFLILHIRRLYPSHKKNDMLFKEMEGFLRTKESRQCRSHHQKRGDVKDILAYLRGFYYENYEIRLLDVEHMQAELRHYLTKVNPAFLQQIQLVDGSEANIDDIVETFAGNLEFILSNKYLPILSRDQSTQTDFKEDKETQTDGFAEARKALEEFF